MQGISPNRKAQKSDTHAREWLSGSLKKDALKMTKLPYSTGTVLVQFSLGTMHDRVTTDTRRIRGKCDELRRDETLKEKKNRRKTNFKHEVVPQNMGALLNSLRFVCTQPREDEINKKKATVSSLSRALFPAEHPRPSYRGPFARETILGSISPGLVGLWRCRR